MNTFQVLLPANQIPSPCNVTKKCGTKVYVLVDSVTIYNINGYASYLKAEGVKYLLSGTGTINKVADTDMFLADLDIEQLRKVMDERGRV